MKARAIGFALLITASAVWGQTAPSKANQGKVATQVPHAKPITLPITSKRPATTASPAPKTAATPAPSVAKPSAKVAAAAKPAPATKTVVAPKPVRKPARKLSQPPQTAPPEAVAPPRKTVITASDRRDPFVSVIRSGGIAEPSCSTGKKCLVAGQIILRGVVKSADGYIGVVENPQRRVYFLRVGDPIFNGQVIKIMSDSIVFRERIIDKVGKEHMREVAKRLPVANEPLAGFAPRTAGGAAPSIGPALLSPLTRPESDQQSPGQQ